MRGHHAALRWISVLLLSVLATAACGGSDNGEGDAQDEPSEAVDDGADDTEDADADESESESDEDGDGALAVDNCSLLTDEEVSSLSDRPLSAGEDSRLGCGFLAAGETIADFSIRAFRSEDTVADHAGELAPGAEIIEVDGVGDEAAGLITVDDEVNFLVARQGDLFVELVMTFLDVPPDSANFERAQELATLALERLVEAV